ncbi:MAG: hypothetical protein WDN28_02145 [Chthoniobacter sp.]
MDEDIIEKAELYVARRGRHLAGRLGFGIYGIVFATESNDQPGVSALKIHHWEEPYRREREVYERLQEQGVTKICGLRIPRMTACDDVLLALELTMVKPPFLLDFASAYLDFPPTFSEEVWAEWGQKNVEQFDTDWPMAQTILAELEDLGIHMLDPSPSNIRFR